MADEELAREEVGCESREDGRSLSPTGGHSDENNLEATELTASRVAKADFPGWSEEGAGVRLFVAVTRLVGPTLFCSFRRWLLQAF